MVVGGGDVAGMVTVAHVDIKSFERSSGINLGMTIGADSHIGESGG